MTSITAPGFGLLPPIRILQTDRAALIEFVEQKDLTAFLSLARRLANDHDLLNSDRHVTIAEVLRVPRGRQSRTFVHLLMHSWTSRARPFLDAVLAEFVTPADQYALIDIFSTPDAMGYTVPAVAADLDIVEMIEIMQRRGMSLGMRNKGNLSPVHIALGRGHYAAIKAFAEAGVSVNLQNDLGETPLHWAVGMGDIQRVDVLLQYGAEPSLRIRSRLGLTPVDMAERSGDGEMQAVLENVRS
ncbi:ankyrin repeat-containing domain protein [Plectosphaerella plurivora]|uniref:Ankyrin repeat-containing domain protein n=1 Tax=Plectosphaerella plurivora TaxID=936078 RepID=A0A9P8V6X0_9PEZI|nr:ankyrin repeat-containing domain protein [Plectosphaerella plurivora]